MRNANKILIGEQKTKRPLSRPKYKREDDIK